MSVSAPCFCARSFPLLMSLFLHMGKDSVRVVNVEKGFGMRTHTSSPFPPSQTSQSTYPFACIVRFTFIALLASSSGDLTTGNRRSPPVSRDDDEGDGLSEKRRVAAALLSVPKQWRLATDGKNARVTEGDMKESKRRSGRCLCSMVNVESTSVGRFATDHQTDCLSIFSRGQ